MTFKKLFRTYRNWRHECRELKKNLHIVDTVYAALTKGHKVNFV